MKALIYIAQNRNTGMAYVGCTTKSLAQRRAEHLNDAEMGSPYKFHRALREAGHQAFEWQILEHCTSEDMYDLERLYIAKLNTYRRGLNSTDGGKAPPRKGPRTPWQSPAQRYRVQGMSTLRRLTNRRF